MSEKIVENFETEIYALLNLMMKNPETLQQKSAELKRIFNNLPVIKNPAELEKILQGLRANGLFTLQIYHYASAVIQEVEKNLKTAASNRNLQNITFLNSNVVKRRKSADKQAEAVMNYLRN